MRVLWPHLSAEFLDPNGPVRRPLRTHLLFAVPAAAVLPVMMYSGGSRRGLLHRGTAGVFVVLWAGTFVTGIFLLPSSTAPAGGPEVAPAPAPR